MHVLHMGRTFSELCMWSFQCSMSISSKKRLLSGSLKMFSMGHQKPIRVISMSDYSLTGRLR